MAASTFDGSLRFWKDGLPMAAGQKSGAAGGDYAYWQFALGFLRNTAAGSVPPAEPSSGRVRKYFKHPVRKVEPQLDWLKPVHPPVPSVQGVGVMSLPLPTMAGVGVYTPPKINGEARTALRAGANGHAALVMSGSVQVPIRAATCGQGALVMSGSGQASLRTLALGQAAQIMSGSNQTSLRALSQGTGYEDGLALYEQIQDEDRWLELETEEQELLGDRTMRPLVKGDATRDYRKVHKVADDFEEKLRRLIKRAFREGKESINFSKLERAIEHQDEMGILSEVNDAILAFDRSLREELEELLLKAVIESAETNLKGFASKLLRAAADDPEVGFVFDKTNKKAREWARDHAAETIKGINETTRDEIRELVEQAFDEQFTVDELADRIGDVIGDDARAETIARTEAIRASNEGQMQLWDQAKGEGLLTGEEKKEWIVTPDDRLCPICEPLDGVTVGLNEQFDVDGESIDGPPAHPNCRCALGLSV